MSFRNLLQKFGAWTTVMKWNEPWLFRVRLKGDWLPRTAAAFAVGSLPTALLLVLFAINVKPPHPLFAFAGMATIGGLAWMFLMRGRSTAGGRVRICQEGICRKRMYVGLTSQWAEEWSWPYNQITQGAIIPGQALNQTFSILLISDGSQVELIGVPEHVELTAVVQFLTSKGVLVRQDVELPSQFARPMGLPIPLIAGAMGLVVLLGSFAFYGLKVTFRGTEVADSAEIPDRAPRFRHAHDPGEQNPGLDPTGGIGVPAPPGIPVPLPDFPQLPDLPVRPAPPVSDLRPANLPPTPTPPTPTETTSTPTTQPQAASDSPTPASTPEPTSSRQPDPPQPAAAAAPAASAGTANKTDMLGGTGGFPFEVNTPDRQAAIGFRFRLGSWAGKQAVALLDPLSQRSMGNRPDVVLARDGYVVGGIQVDAPQDLVHAVRVVFVRRNSDGMLDKTDYYFSDWIGKPPDGPVKTLGKGNVPILGVYGRRGVVIDAIGLLMAES